MRRQYVARLSVAAIMIIIGCSAEDPSPGPTTGVPSSSAMDSNSSPSAASTPADPPARSESAGPSPTAAKRPDPERQAGLDQQLRDAAWHNDVGTAQRLIKAGADVNAKDETEQSAYLVATSEGYLRLLQLTLNNGADVGSLDSWKGTGLIRAAERGHGFVVGELLQAGIARDHVNRIGYQAIHEAVWLGEDTDEYLTTLRVLAAGGARLSDRSVNEGLTPLEMARQRGHQRQQQVLTRLTEDTAPNNPDHALLAAARDGDADAVALALRAGADLETRDAGDRTALLLATADDHVAAADVLVAMGTRPAGS
ncbi:MAG TPA: ankyrin repeat domain-containing protein [Microlunatus sp.]